MAQARTTEVRTPPQNTLLVAPILPTLLRLALPNLAAMLATTAVAIAETAYVGVLGTTQLAAVALVFPLTMLMQMLSAGAMGGGVSSAISRALGAGDEARAQSLAFHAAAIGISAGITFSLLFLIFVGPILGLLGGKAAVLDEAVHYANVVLTASIFIWLLNTLASIVRGTGNMRLPSWTLIAASVVQIAVGGALGLGIGPIPSFGLAGVGVGLVISNVAAAAFLFWFLCSGQGRIMLRRAQPFDRTMFWDILRVGAVSSIGPFQVVLTVLIITGLVARYGTETLAGYGIGARLEFLLVPIVFAIGVASVPMVGMAVGSGSIERARHVAWTAARVAVVVLGAIGLVVTLLPDAWSGLFTAEAAVREAANLYLRCVGIGFAFVGLGLSLYFASQGSGKVVAPVLAGTSRLIVIVVGGALLAGSAAPAWSIFALIAASMMVFGLSIATAVYLTPWGAPIAQSR
jgi:putative MATE family efflux protein